MITTVRIAQIDARGAVRKTVFQPAAAGINKFIDRSFHFLIHGQVDKIATFEIL